MKLYVALFLLCLHPRATMAEVMLLSPDGPLQPGAEQEILIVLHDHGLALDEPPPDLLPDSGEIVTATQKLGTGLYSFRFRPSADASDRVEFTLNTDSGTTRISSLPVASIARATLMGPDRVDVVAGSENDVTLLFKGEDLPEPQQLKIVLTEGEVKDISSGPSGLSVTIRMGSERYPRMALLGVWDSRKLDRAPEWVPVFISGRPVIPIRTEPSARVWLTVGKRHYGPFQADQQGIAQARLTVKPGEETASVRILDNLGNEQQTTLTLTGDPKPVMALLAEPPRPPGTRAAPVYLAALDSRGRPWSGPLPVCQATPGGFLPVVTMEAGSYRVSPSSPSAAEYLDVKLRCELTDTVTANSVRIPIGEGVPRRLTLRLYPDQLSADFPVAQVQAILEDWRGERMDPRHIELKAELGSISVDSVKNRSLHAEYQGSRAVARGGDIIKASLDLDPGNGPPAALQVFPQRAGQDSLRLGILGRALDYLGRPLQGVEMTLTIGSASAKVLSDSRGWGQASLPLEASGELIVLENRAGGLVRRTPYLENAGIRTHSTLDPDLEATVHVPISAGLVREVFITTTPSTLYSGPAAAAKVTVRLVDKHGNTVTDEGVKVSTTAGRVGTLHPRADGTYQGWYWPPASMKTGTIRITASGRESTFAATTEIKLLPRPMNRNMGIGLGAITNLGSIHSPLVELSLEQRTPFFNRRLLFRLAAMAYSDKDTVEDNSTANDISVRTTFNPFYAGLLARQEHGLRSSWIGAAMALVMYRTETDFNDPELVRGTGIGGPGIVLFGGLGWRLGVGELGLELRYLQVSTSSGAVEYAGGIGGLVALPTYRILF